MRVKGLRIKDMTPDRAGEVAAQAMEFVAQDAGRLRGFLAATGLDPADLGAALSEPGLLVAVLDYLASDESLLLVFAAQADLAPEAVGQARALLGGARDA